MAGMLPGVECARRRRFHLSSDSPSAAAYGGSSRRTSFCLYTSKHEVSHCSISSLRSMLNEEYENEKLGATARRAKERLDERLRTQQRKSASRRKDDDTGSVNVRGRDGNSRSAGVGCVLQTEIYCSRKSWSKRFNWAKLNWKAIEQDECTICLEGFKSGETLVQLPCAHRFHCKCLVPWLENNAHCPCCRMDLYVEIS